jgi:bis(5'-nucleosidyl)-tetraphosphatase
MIHEYSAGVIPVRNLNNKWCFFLVQLKTGHWGFPKGHTESYESLTQTAIRELKEETGFDIDRFLTIAPYVVKYFFHRDHKLVHKQVTYFPALVKGEVKLQEEEIQDGKWVTSAEACSLITFEQEKSIAASVSEIIVHADLL